MGAKGTRDTGRFTCCEDRIGIGHGDECTVIGGMGPEGEEDIGGENLTRLEDRSASSDGSLQREKIAGTRGGFSTGIGGIADEKMRLRSRLEISLVVMK